MAPAASGQATLATPSRAAPRVDRPAAGPDGDAGESPSGGLRTEALRGQRYEKGLREQWCETRVRQAQMVRRLPSRVHSSRTMIDPMIEPMMPDGCKAPWDASLWKSR